MLILAEGTIHQPVQGDERTAIQAWLGPMVDDGFVQNGYLDRAGDRIWMFLSSADMAAAQQRLGDIPAVRSGTISFTMTPVTALRFR